MIINFCISEKVKYTQNIQDNRIKRINIFLKVDIHQNNKGCLFTIRFVGIRGFIMYIVLKLDLIDVAGKFEFNTHRCNLNSILI